MIKRVVLSAQAKADLAVLDRAVGLRILATVQRFASTGAGNVQGLRGIHPPSSVSASETGGSASTTMAIGSMCSASAIARTLTAERFKATVNLPS